MDKTRIIPDGYSKGYLMTFVGLIFGVWCGGLVAVAASTLLSSGDFIITVPLIIMAAIFLIGFPSVNLYNNRKAKKRIAYMDEMLSKTRVSGKITDVIKTCERFGREREWREGDSVKSTVYRFIVAYVDPFGGEIKTAVSERYSELVLIEKVKGKLRLAPCFDEEYTDVYAAEDGRAWIELIYKEPEIRG